MRGSGEWDVCIDPGGSKVKGGIEVGRDGVGVKWEVWEVRVERKMRVE